MARLHHPLDTLLLFLRRQDREAVLDDLHCCIEDRVHWTLPEPRAELGVGRRADLDTTRPRQTQDRVALLLADRAFGPGDLDQRRQEERRGRVDGHPEFHNPAQELRVVHLQFLRQRAGDLLKPGLLPQSLDELGVLLAEIRLLLPPPAFLKDVFFHSFSLYGSAQRPCPLGLIVDGWASHHWLLALNVSKASMAKITGVDCPLSPTSSARGTCQERRDQPHWLGTSLNVSAFVDV